MSLIHNIEKLWDKTSFFIYFMIPELLRVSISEENKPQRVIYQWQQDTNNTKIEQDHKSRFNPEPTPYPFQEGGEER